jgi:hypothetical protein
MIPPPYLYKAALLMLTETKIQEEADGGEILMSK